MNKCDKSLINPLFADRIQQIEPFHVMALLEKAKFLEQQGQDVIHMEVGEPDFPTPETIVQAGQRALSQGLTKYTPAVGILALREKIADYYLNRYGVSVDPARIIITPGASGALLLALSALINPTDGVLLTDPGYPCNKNFVELLNATPQLIALTAETGFQLTDALLQQYWQQNSKVALLASPSNPTGTLLDAQTIAKLYQVCSENDGWLIIDEIYHELTYQGNYPSALSINPNIIVVNSFSKYFGMTGWRLGWLVVPDCLIGPCDKLAQNLFLSAPTIAQYAALEAFSTDTMAILEQRKAIFARRRRLLLDGLRQLGFVIPIVGEGAFYLYADCSRFTQDSFQFAHQLLEDIFVAVTPGIDFSQQEAHKYIRFAYTTDESRIEIALKRLQQYLN